jgi:hypothetical protein
MQVDGVDPPCGRGVVLEVDGLRGFGTHAWIPGDAAARRRRRGWKARAYQTRRPLTTAGFAQAARRRRSRSSVTPAPSAWRLPSSTRRTRRPAHSRTTSPRPAPARRRCGSRRISGAAWPASACRRKSRRAGTHDLRGEIATSKPLVGRPARSAPNSYRTSRKSVARDAQLGKGIAFHQAVELGGVDPAIGDHRQHQQARLGAGAVHG